MQETDREILKKIIFLTIPSAIDFALQSVANYADYIMVGRLGQNASASIGLTTEVFFLFCGLFMALGVGIVSGLLLLIAAVLFSLSFHGGWVQMKRFGRCLLAIF